MRVLGIETAGKAVGVALVEGSEVLAEAWVAAPQRHCRELVSLIDFCLRKADLTLGKVDGFAVSLGPGSFTGLRIGLATAKALAQATGKKLAGVPTFEALAVAAGEFAGIICPVLPSRPGEVYAAFVRRRDGGVIYLSPPFAVPPAALPARLPEGEEAVLLVGEGAPDVVAAGASHPRVVVAAPVAGRLLAACVAWLAQEKLAVGGDDLFLLEPLYLRPPGITVRGG